MIRVYGLCLALLAGGAAAAQEGPRRVIAAGGSAAEIVAALGAGARLVARDTTSVWPPDVLALPDIGYVRALSPENLSAMSPDLILADHDAGPPEAIAVLREAGVNIVILPEARDPAGVTAKITAAADALAMPQAGARLAAGVAAELAEARAGASALSPRPRVLFILSLQGGRILAAGTDTAAAAMIALAGGVNAVEGFSGYKPLGDEAAILAAPDILLLMDRGGEHSTGDALDFPALAATPAGRSGRVLRMDGLYLLGFGPRVGRAAQELTGAFAAAMAGGGG